MKKSTEKKSLAKLAQHELAPKEAAAVKGGPIIKARSSNRTDGSTDGTGG
jgi:hypothetical protein